MRRWVSTYDGPVKIEGLLRNTSAAGDGTVGRVFKNGLEIFSETSNGRIVWYSVETTVAPGDIVDFAMDADGGGNYDPVNAVTTINNVLDGSDGTTFTARIVTSAGGGGTPFRRGDVDGVDGILLTDGVFLLNFLFLGGPEPPCFDAADANDDGSLDITSGVFLFNWLSLGGPSPPAPGAAACGDDPTPDSLDCAAYTGC